MTRPRILVAGIGNVFLGDDAFGVVVAGRLARQALPPEVRVVDFGIRGMDLAYALLDGYELAIFVDAAPRGGPPGTLYVIQPDVPSEAAEMSPHGLTPENVIRLAMLLGERLPALRVVGCEPANLGSDEEPALEMSPPVQMAVDEAIRLVEAIWTEALARVPPEAAHA